MITLQKSTFATLHHLAGDEIYLQLLAYFYKNKNRVSIQHREIRTFFKGKTTQYVSHYLRSMIKFKLIESVSSAFNDQNLGYKITDKGIKFFELYKTIEAQVA